MTQRALLEIGTSAGLFGALVFLCGKLWTQSYYSVFGLPTSDIDLGTLNYAFQLTEVILIAVLATLMAGFITFWTDTAEFLIGWLAYHHLNLSIAKRDLLRLAWRCSLSLGIVGLILILLAPTALDTVKILYPLALCLTAYILCLMIKLVNGECKWLTLFRKILLGVIIICAFSISVYLSLYLSWSYSTLIRAFWGGISLGLIVGTSVILIRQDQVYRVFGAILLVSAVALIPSLVGKLAVTAAQNDIDSDNFPIARLTFKDAIPASISEANLTSVQVRVIHLSDRAVAVVSTEDCKLDASIKHREYCEIIAFERDALSYIRYNSKHEPRSGQISGDASIAAEPWLLYPVLPLTTAEAAGSQISARADVEFTVTPSPSVPPATVQPATAQPPATVQPPATAQPPDTVQPPATPQPPATAQPPDTVQPPRVGDGGVVGTSATRFAK